MERVLEFMLTFKVIEENSVTHRSTGRAAGYADLDHLVGRQGVHASRREEILSGLCSAEYLEQNRGSWWDEGLKSIQHARVKENT
jgi:hypothetical protein